MTVLAEKYAGNFPSDVWQENLANCEVHYCSYAIFYWWISSAYTLHLQCVSISCSVSFWYLVCIIIIGVKKCGCVFILKISQKSQRTVIKKRRVNIWW